MFVASRHHSAQVFPKTGIRYGDAFPILDRNAIAAGGGENPESHGDAVITPRIDRARQLFPTGPYSQTVAKLVDLCSHRAKILDDRIDPVALLHPQFSGAADFQLDPGAGSDASEQW